MNPRLRRIAAGFAGVISAFATVALVEMAGQAVYAPPPAFDLSNREAIAAFIRGLPTGAFVIVLVGWFLAVVVGTLVATAIAGARPRLYAALVGGVVMLATLANFALVPHPLWFVVAGIVDVLLAALLAGWFATTVVRRRAEGAVGG